MKALEQAVSGLATIVREFGNMGELCVMVEAQRDQQFGMVRSGIDTYRLSEGADMQAEVTVFDDHTVVRPT